MEGYIGAKRFGYNNNKFFSGSTTTPRGDTSRESDTGHEGLERFGGEVSRYAFGRSESSPELQAKNDRPFPGIH